DLAVVQVRVDLKMPTDQRKVWREDMRQHHVAEIVQQPGQVAETGFRSLGAWNGAVQAIDHRRGVDRLLPVRRRLLRLVARQAQRLAQHQAQRQIDHQIETQYANNG